MKQWEVPEEEGWTVKLDVEDMGGHLGTTCRAGGSSLACRVRKMIAAVFALGAALQLQKSSLSLLGASSCQLVCTALMVLACVKLVSGRLGLP